MGDYMGTVLITETISVTHESPGESLFKAHRTEYAPGPADAVRLREALGDVLYDAAVRLGVIVEIP